MRHNDVPEILFPTNATALVANKEVTDLLPGQVGIFSEDTGKSIVEPTENFFIAVGLDKNGDGATDDIRKSAGRNIQPGNILYATRQDYVAPVDQVIDIKDIKVMCGDSFGIKIEARNEQIYNVQGTVQYRQSFVAKAEDCDSCADNPCEEANTARIVRDIVLQARLSGDPFYKVEPTDSAGAVVSDEDLQANIEANDALPDMSTQKRAGLKITAIATKVQNFANVNLDYVAARQTQVLVSLVGENAVGTVSTETELVYEQGTGYDVRELEFQTIGFREGNTGAYRIGAVTCLPNEVEYESDLKKKYTVFTLAYDHFHRNGSWLQYDNALATYFVLESTDTAGIEAVQTLLGKLTEVKTTLAKDGDTGITGEVPNP